MPIPVDTYKFVKIAVDTNKDDSMFEEEEYKVSPGLAERVREDYNNLDNDDWQRRISFLNRIINEYSDTDLEEWAIEEKSNLVDVEMTEKAEELLDEALRNDPMGKIIVDYYDPDEWTGEIAYETFKGRGTLENNVGKSLPEIINRHKKEIYEYLEDERKMKELENIGRFSVMPDEKLEVPTDPHEIEKTYREVGGEEWDERHGPVPAGTYDKLNWPDKDVNDWLEQKEKGVTIPPSEQEMYMDPPSSVTNEEQYWYDWLREKKSQTFVINILTKIANQLDQKRFYNEANELDKIIKKI
jgi:hypothetical protein